MRNEKILLIAFVLMVAAQIYVPANMIFHQEDILNTGKIFRFKAAPVDPVDPLRGRYVVLRFDENEIEQDTGIWKMSETVYVHLKEGIDGFAEIKAVSKEAPQDGADFLKTTVDNPPNQYRKVMRIAYPFNRYYMEEFKATQAERTYWNSLRDTSKVTYAVVSIKEGDYALRDVMINGVSLKEVVESEVDK